MKRRISYQRIGFILFLTASVGLLWRGLAAQNAEEKPEEPKPALVDSETLGGLDRYLTFASTDKPIYRPGETVYVRGIVLQHATHQPLAEGLQVASVIELKGPKGDTVASGTATSEDSVVGFSWQVPPEQAGGEYIVRMTYPWHGLPPAERKFEVRAYRAPRLKSQIKFLRDGYGPGDEVTATLEVTRAEGGIPEGAKVSVIARVDGDVVYEGATEVDAKGNSVARFPLPVDIRRGEGTLALVIEDGGVVETASKTIPILLQTVDLTMYPEGGDLVAGLPNRVYIEAFTPAKKPADLAGVIRDDEGNEVADFRTEHEGRGRFGFTPEEGKKYTLAITEPAGIKTVYPLPEAKASGVVLHADRDTYAAGEPVTLLVGANPRVEGLHVTLAKREVVLEKVAPVTADGELAEATFDDIAANGVLVATAWSGDGMPLAERLIFRQPARSVQVEITADAKQYVPGGKAKLTVKTTDESGKPISAVVGITVTDDSVLEMIEKREQAPRLPVMVLLENEVRDLADAHVYFDAENEKAPLAVDLLLGTQGWRRFAFLDTAKFIEANGDAARRTLALKMASVEEQMLQAHALRGGAVRFNRNEALEVEKFRVFDDAADGAAVPLPAAAPVDAAVPDVAAPPVGAEEPGAEPAENPVAGPEVANGGDRQAAAAKPALPPRDQKERQEQGARADLRKALGGADKNARRRRIIGEADEDLDRIGGFGGIAVGDDFVAVRVYAHQVRPDREPGQRIDFTETLFWNAGIKTDEQGQASVEFGLSDSVTSFRVLADAFSASGALGAANTAIESVEPFYLEPKMPLEVTAGDRILLPVGVVNATDATLEGAQFGASSHTAIDIVSPLRPFDLAPKARKRHVIELMVGRHNGSAHFTLTGRAGPYADEVTRTLVIKPSGFPIQLSRGGLINPGDLVTQEITIPDTMVAGSLKARVVVYPTPLASMTEALESLIREPYGCFEQTSSTTYPLVMAQQYFLSHQGVDPTMVERSSQILETGYQRLLGFECKSGGYEWFGSDPGHDALTAYGLLEFTDMAQVRHVDPAMLERTRKWMLEQRDGKGGYQRKTHTLHTWLADPEVANSYNTWAMLSAGIDADLSTEANWVREEAQKSENSYVTALAANVMIAAGDKEGEEILLDKLAGKQSDDGSVQGATTSVVGSGGEALVIETTSLAALAWLHNPHYVANVEKAIQYLAEVCKGGRFGSTQSTVLALKAIVEYDKSRAVPKAPGSLELLVDDEAVGSAVAFTAETKGAIELPDASALLTPGKHKVQVRMNDGSNMPYSVAIDFNSLKPDSAEDCKLHLETRLRDEKLGEGEVTEAEVVVVNRTNEAVPTPVAIVGIPGGLEVRHDQLKELVKAGKIAAYEVRGREVVLYWRSLAAEERVDLPLSLVAAVPGSYAGPASRAYLYYTDELKHWNDALAIEITPKNEE